MSAYKKLEAHFADYTAFKSVAALLNWDASAMMPEKGGDQRARQSAAVGVHLHNLLADPALPDLMDKAATEDLNVWPKAH
ncbi:MAG TPA: carboxypeptidase M32, partial [Candidatus Accumulibacter sp.]|nr:carboxypeptidase M32 [Accumulibacter sp.]